MILTFRTATMTLTILLAIQYPELVVGEGKTPSVPPAISGLLPNGARLAGGDWGVLPTEFGTTFTGGMRAEFPGRPASCDITVGPELRVSIKGDTAWEQPPMLDMAIDIYTSDIARARTSLPDRVTILRTSNVGFKSASAVMDEEFAGGRVIYLEYTENCARHPNGTNTIMLGFARRGATIMTFDLWMSTGASDAKAMAEQMLTRFSRLDIASLVKIP